MYRATDIRITHESKISDSLEGMTSSSITGQRVSGVKTELTASVSSSSSPSRTGTPLLINRAPIRSCAQPGLTSEMDDILHEVNTLAFESEYKVYENTGVEDSELMLRDDGDIDGWHPSTRPFCPIGRRSQREHDTDSQSYALESRIKSREQHVSNTLLFFFR